MKPTIDLKLDGSSSVNNAKDKVPEGYNVIYEGTAAILSEKANKVFYNEVQVKNRDLSILVLNAFAEQVELEAKLQVEKRKRDLSWRKVTPTIDTWGESYNDQEKSGFADKEISKPDVEISEKDFKLEGLFILEALAASGLRSIRYCNEIKSGVGVAKIICNDLEQHAVDAMKKNIEFNESRNKSSKLSECIATQKNDAVLAMLAHRLEMSQNSQHTRVLPYLEKMQDVGKTYAKDFDQDAFDVIDIDPYGSCSIFLDSAVQSVTEGGMLCITSTDLATLCGKNLEVCFSKYESMGFKTKACHELAIRIVLSCLDKHANRHGKYIVPQLCLQTDFYLRCFVRVYGNRAEVKKSATKQGFVFKSPSIESFFIQPLAVELKGVHKAPHINAATVCPDTDQAMKIGGPIWIGPLQNPAFVKHLLRMFKVEGSAPNPYLSHWDKSDFRSVGNAANALKESKFNPNNLQSAAMLEGILTAVSEELVCPDSILFYHLPAMCKTLRISTPSLQKVQSALANAGYNVSQVHCCAQGIKTNAKSDVVWDVLRAWTKQNEVAPKTSVQGDVAIELRNKIMAKDVKLDVDFSMNKKVLMKFRERKGFASKNDSKDKNKDKKKNFRKVSRWKGNPKPNWGPKSAAHGNSNLQTHKRQRTSE